MSTFQIVDLIDYVFFQEGPGLRTYQWTTDGMKVVTIGMVTTSGTIDINYTQKYISIEEFEKKYSHFAIEEGDILLTSSGVSYGKIARVRKEHLPMMMNTSLIRFHTNDKDSLDQDFLYIYMRSHWWKGQMDGFALGSAQPNFGPIHVKKMKLILPPIEIQRKISSILSPIDDKIELNRRMNETLEQMAMILYKHWFVDYGPFQDGEFEESELGIIPKGWGVSNIGLEISILGGGTPSTKNDEYWRDGSQNWYSPTDLTSSKSIYLTESSRKISQKGLDNSSAKLFPAYSVMLTSRATIGEIAFNRTPASTNQGFIVLIPNEQYPRCFLYCWLKGNMDVIHSISNGSTFREVNRSNFKALPLLKSEKIADFETKVRDLFDQIECNTEEIKTLTTLRDYLLPRLLSGGIEVQAAEEQIQEVLSHG